MTKNIDIIPTLKISLTRKPSLQLLIMLFLIITIPFIISCNDENKQPSVKQGTDSDPFLIYTKDDLYKFRDNINNNINTDKSYKLMADIDMSNEPSWVVIGTELNKFSGAFDGNGKKIKNISIGSANNHVSIQCAGLFGYLLGAKIKNLSVEWKDLFITAYTYVGGVVGSAENLTEITNCNSSGDIILNASSETSYSGGIVGRMMYNGVLLNCKSTSNISLVSNSEKSFQVVIGGIVGHSWQSNIYGCNSTGNISSEPTQNTSYSIMTGGILGSSDKSRLKNCYYSGKINSKASSNNYTGGIVGYDNIGEIINCFATGDVSAWSFAANSYSGGIVGYCEYPLCKTINCYSSGNILSVSQIIENPPFYHISSSAGGICGWGAAAYCIALNPSIISVGSAENSTHRICTNEIGINNFATPTILVKSGQSINKATPITLFTNIITDGKELTANPVDLLNGYLIEYPTSSYEYKLSKWMATVGLNNGLPYFE